MLILFAIGLIIVGGFVGWCVTRPASEGGSVPDNHHLVLNEHFHFKWVLFSHLPDPELYRRKWRDAGYAIHMASYNKGMEKYVDKKYQYYWNPSWVYDLYDSPPSD